MYLNNLAPEDNFNAPLSLIPPKGRAKNMDNQAQTMMNCSLNDNMTFDLPSNMTGGSTGANTASSITSSSSTTNAAMYYNYPNGHVTVWDYWQGWYYPQVIRESYPVYIQEKALDKGKKAFEIVKILKDKELIRMDRVKDFIDLMDELIKIL